MLALAIEIALALMASDPALRVRFRQRFRAPYDLTGPVLVRANGSFLYELTGSAFIRLSARFPYALPPPVMVAAAILLPYRVWALPCTVSVALPYAGMRLRALALALPYRLTACLAVPARLTYDLLNIERIGMTARLRYTVVADRKPIPIDATPEVIHQGRRMPGVSANLSMDEGSLGWIADIEIARLADYVEIGIGDPIQLDLAGALFGLFVEGKELSRAPEGETYGLKASSPVLLRGAPYVGETAFTASTAVSARELVEHLIGPVSWELADWLIPQTAAVFAGSSPLGIAADVLDAAGAVLESMPDGTPRCRWRYPVHVPDYPTASPDALLYDQDIFSSKASIAPVSGFNRVIVSNQPIVGDGGSDSVEFAFDAGSQYAGTLRAYPADGRAVTISHTGNPATALSATTLSTRTETEVIEIKDGLGSVQYAMASLLAYRWLHNNLGVIGFKGRNVVAQVAGYSLLEIRYTVTSLNARASLGANEPVQFVIEG